MKKLLWVEAILKFMNRNLLGHLIEVHNKKCQIWTSWTHTLPMWYWLQPETSQQVDRGTTKDGRTNRRRNTSTAPGRLTCSQKSICHWEEGKEQSSTINSNEREEAATSPIRKGNDVNTPANGGHSTDSSICGQSLLETKAWRQVEETRDSAIPEW